MRRTLRYLYWMILVALGIACVRSFWFTDAAGYFRHYAQYSDGRELQLESLGSSIADRFQQDDGLKYYHRSNYWFSSNGSVGVWSCDIDADVGTPRGGQWWADKDLISGPTTEFSSSTLRASTLVDPPFYLQSNQAPLTRDISFAGFKYQTFEFSGRIGRGKTTKIAIPYWLLILIMILPPAYRRMRSRLREQHRPGFAIGKEKGDSPQSPL